MIIKIEKKSVILVNQAQLTVEFRLYAHIDLNNCILYISGTIEIYSLLLREDILIYCSQDRSINFYST